MADPRAPARAVLLTLPGDDYAVNSRAFLGKSLALRQLEFALDSGCDTVVLLGDGRSADSISLTHVAEARGARALPVSTPHALAGAVGKDGTLLVLQPRLLPDSIPAAEMLCKGAGVLVLPAGAGVQAGFERIDLDRAWSGALVMPGHLLGKLRDLPEDIEPNAALLRIALQARLPESHLGEQPLAENSWAMITPTSDMAATEEKWLDRHLAVPAKYSLSQRIAHWVIRRQARQWLLHPGALPLLVALAALLAVTGTALAHYGLAVAGLLVIAAVPTVVEAAISLGRLRKAPFGRSRFLSPLRLLVDIALLTSGFLAIPGDLPGRIFPPLALVLALRGAPAHANEHPAGVLTDHTSVALVLAGLAGLLGPSLAFMAAAILVLVANIANAALSARRSG